MMYRLTPTELRVLLAIVDIGGVPEVAAALGVAVTTVKTHLGRLFEKTGVARQADLVSWSQVFPPRWPVDLGLSQRSRSESAELRRSILLSSRPRTDENFLQISAQRGRACHSLDRFISGPRSGESRDCRARHRNRRHRFMPRADSFTNASRTPARLAGPGRRAELEIPGADRDADRRRKNHRTALRRTELGLRRWQRREGESGCERPGASAEDIPWLKLEVTERRGNGLLADVAIVQRINTKGGVLKGTCDAEGSYRIVPYSADYVFLRNNDPAEYTSSVGKTR